MPLAPTVATFVLATLLAAGCSSAKTTEADGPCSINGKCGRDASVDASSPDSQVVAVADVSVAAIGLDSPTCPFDSATTESPLDASAPDAPISGPGFTKICDDGLSCTKDVDVAGICQSTLSPGHCLIDEACYADGDTKPGDPCRACAVDSSTSRWTALAEGASCGTGKSCQANVCADCGSVGKACCGATTPGTCEAGIVCNAAESQCRPDKAIDLSGGEDTLCARFQSGSVRCWGTNGAMLGASTDSSVAAPPIAGLQDAVDISVGLGIACAVRAAGTVFCWGNTLAGGAPVPGITNATQVSAGPHTCVRTSDSKVLCWGTNRSGELGLGTTGTSATSTPQEMVGVTDAQRVAACGSATCVLRKDGRVSCTGASKENGQTASTSSIADLTAVFGAISLSCSTSDTTATFWAITKNATLLTWGQDHAPRAEPETGQVVAATWAKVSGGGPSWLAIQADGTLWAGGDNTWGQLGDGTFIAPTVRTSPRLVHRAASVTDAVAVAAASPTSGGVATCLLRADGSIGCAGQNAGSGGGTALGDGQHVPQAPRSFFVPVVGILPAASEDGQCYDGIDNDGDGQADLDDSDCAQNLGSATGAPVATVSFAGTFGNYLRESCNSAASLYGGPEAVLTWTAPSAGIYQLDTNGSTFDTVLAAYKGNPLTSCTELGCNDDGATLSNGASAIRITVVVGDSVTLVVDSKAAPLGPASFNLNITKQ
jgi:hypothetical protein